ncbi:hypothetical protein EAH79_00885 [Sphingomonas koreensis]|nr:hypothetical protein EAH79_00885 [Sphingomonas koreensis]
MRPDKNPAQTLARLLPAALPSCGNTRLLLFAIRRLGAHGIDDAQATTAFVTAFGQGFRRPLVLVRSFMRDLATTARTPITIAPCCCRRVTASEATLLTVVARSETDPGRAGLLLADLLGVQRAGAVLTGAAAISAAFADTGRPIAG